MSNASRLVDKLKEKGYVKRQECEEDRRRVDIVITKKGLDIVGRASDAVEQTMLDNFQTTSDEEFDQLSGYARPSEGINFRRLNIIIFL